MEDELFCTICSKKYTLANIPRLIPKCGHTYCQGCLQKLLDKCTPSTDQGEPRYEIRCSEDQEITILDENNIHYFPKNIALLKLVANKQQDQEIARKTRNGTNQPQKTESDQRIPIQKTQTDIGITDSTNKIKESDVSFDESHIVKVSGDNNPDDEMGELITVFNGGKVLPSIEETAYPSQTKMVDLEDICLAHQKPLEIICIKDLKRICSTCAIFGEHKGHDFKSTDEVQRDMKQREECILVLMDIHATLTQKISGKDAKDEISKQLAIRKEAFIKDIKNRYARLAEIIKTSERKSLEKLTSTFVSLQDRIKEECKVPESIAKRYHMWEDRAYNQIKSFEEHNNFEEQLKLLNYDKRNNAEDILQEGEKIIGEVEAVGASILEARQESLKSVALEFKSELDCKMMDYVIVAVKEPKKSVKSSSPTRRKQSQHSGAKQVLSPPSITKQPTNPNLDDELLLGQQFRAQKDQEAPQASLTKAEQKPIQPIILDREIQSGLHISLPSSSLTSREKRLTTERSEQAKNSSQPETLRTNFEQSQTLKSTLKDSSFTLQSTSKVIPVAKKKPKLKLPQKIDKLFDAIYNDQVQSADFTNAELGDAVTLQIVEHMRGKKVRNLKLIRNKLTDEGVDRMLQYFGNIITLNLSQNMLTDRFVDIVLQNLAKMPSLKNLILSQNKINLRNIKGRIQQIKKNDINVSL